MIDMKKAGKFREAAARLEPKIQDLLVHHNENTPKRQRQGMSRRCDAELLRLTKVAMAALADAWEQGAVPEILQDVRSMKEVYDLVRLRLDSGGYYDIHLSREHADNSPKALAMRLLASRADDRTPEQIAEEKRKADLIAAENEIRFVKIPGFFPTPKPIIDRMIDIAGLDRFSSSCRVLDPSAGKGDIAQAVRDLFPDVGQIDCVEIVPALQGIIKLRGFQVVGSDFLTMEPHECAGYDVILMNPPFESMADIDHVRHAYRFLKTDGALVSLMSASPFFSKQRKAEEFMQWLEQVSGSVETLGPDTFKGKDVFRETGVNIKMVTILG